MLARRAALHVPIERVRAARRVDWRYLLPEYDFRRIAVVTPAQTDPDPKLLAALREDATDVRIIVANGPQAAETHDRDLVVLSHANATTIRWAAAAADADCILYAELRRRPWVPFRATQAIRGTLRRVGFEPLAVHWHRPDHDQCEQIVPLRSPKAVIAALRRKSRGRVGAVRSSIGILLVRLHLFDRVAWPVSVTARWTGPS
jgi:hypothetical protein